MNSRLSLSCFVIVIFLQSCATQAPKKVFPNAPGTTSNAENLTRETNDPSQEYYPTVSPDGRYLLYNAIESSSSWSYGSSGLTKTTNKKSSIIKKEIGQPTKNPLVSNASDPTWLPDGSGVIFAYTKPAKPVIVKSNSDGIGLNYLSQGEMGDDDAEPVVSKDGGKVIFTTLIGGSRMICSMDARGGNYTVITEGGHVRINPMNPNKINYNLRVGNVVQLFTMDLKTGQKTQLTTGDYNNRDGAFSRDGKFIAFASNRENPRSSNHHIYVMNADGTGVFQLTQGQTDEGDPNWGPDYMIYFYSNAEKNYNIWKIKPRF
jgi:TolB protein